MFSTSDYISQLPSTGFFHLSSSYTRAAAFCFSTVQKKNLMHNKDNAPLSNSYSKIKSSLNPVITIATLPGKEEMTSTPATKKSHLSTNTLHRLGTEIITLHEMYISGLEGVIWAEFSITYLILSRNLIESIDKQWVNKYVPICKYK